MTQFMTLNGIRSSPSPDAASSMLKELEAQIRIAPFNSQWGVSTLLWAGDPQLQKMLERVQKVNFRCDNLSISPIAVSQNLEPDKCVPYVNGGTGYDKGNRAILKECARLLMATPFMTEFVKGLSNEVNLSHVNVILRDLGHTHTGFRKDDRISISITVEENRSKT